MTFTYAQDYQLIM
jgi:hypothetical protein